ncbi:hypothetical protein GCM10008094_07000 [Aidingimonas halophila]|nr:hypothetical protein GCM10008094_07000 [Aidingimonas halophila]
MLDSDRVVMTPVSDMVVSRLRYAEIVRRIVRKVGRGAYLKEGYSTGLLVKIPKISNR